MSLYRRAVLAMAGSKRLERFARGRGFALGAGRFVAGETLEGALAAAAELEASGRAVILDLLGELVEDPAGVEAMRAELEAAVDALAAREGSRALSVKPTQLGLGLSLEAAWPHARALAERAARGGVALCLDMENHPYVEGTLSLLERLHDEGHHHVAGVLQSALKRTPSDLERLLARDPVPELRLVKGAYREPAAVAHQRKRDVDAAYARLLARALGAGGKLDVATHDERMLALTRRLARERNLRQDAWEVQMLYGVRRRLQQRLVGEGVPVRIYVPYGADWYGYFTRRLAERPANLGFVLRGLLG